MAALIKKSASDRYSSSIIIPSNRRLEKYDPAEEKNVSQIVQNGTFAKILPDFSDWQVDCDRGSFTGLALHSDFTLMLPDNGI
jgi:hypothetical protein